MINALTLEKGNKVGLIACSDGIGDEFSSKVDELINLLNGFGLEVVVADTLIRRFSFFSGSPVQRAEELNKMFRDEKVKAIFDISGGDSANQVLPYLDYEYIKNNHKPFFGISDLSVILKIVSSIVRNFPSRPHWTKLLCAWLRYAEEYLS